MNFTTVALEVWGEGPAAHQQNQHNAVYNLHREVLIMWLEILIQVLNELETGMRYAEWKGALGRVCFRRGHVRWLLENQKTRESEHFNYFKYLLLC